MTEHHKVLYPREGASVLYPNAAVGARVTEYAADKSSRLPPHIVQYYAHIERTLPGTANFMTPISQAQALLFLAKAVGAKRVLEIGVYVGFSCMVWSHAVGPGGRVTALELHRDFADAAEKAFVANKVENVDVIVGDAIDTLSTLMPPEPYDIIFLDAQKSGYPAYLDRILASSPPSTTSTAAPSRLLRPGGLIIADNVLRCGFVADGGRDNPWTAFDFGPHRKEYWASGDVEAVKAYNDAVTIHPRLDSWLCPLWDGVNIARLVD